MKTIFAFLFMLPLLFSCGKQPQLPKIEGVDGPQFNVMNGQIIIGMRLENINVPVGGRVMIPKTNNSTIEASPALEGGTLLQVTLDPADLNSPYFSFPDPQSLPGGRPIPGVVGGELPSIAVKVPDLFNTTFYASKAVFGFFSPIEIGLDQILTYRIVIQGKAVGNISLVGHDENRENSGLLLLFNLKALQSTELKRLLELSKQPQFKNTLF